MSIKFKKGVWTIIGAIVFFTTLYLIQNIFFNNNEKVIMVTSPDVKESVEPILYPTTSTVYHVPFLSKDLVVHSAYFDHRPRNNHTNITVLFVSVNKTILDSGWILGCGAADTMAKDYTVYSIFDNVFMHDWLGPNPVIYENQLILCYDLPAKNGSRVFAVYKSSENSLEELVSYSRQPLFHPAPHVSINGDRDDISVVVCTKVHNKKVTWFREFIQYQKTLGVDHVDISVLDTFIEDGGYKEKVLNDPIVRKAVNEGFVNFRVWLDIYKQPREVYFHSESLRKLGCIYRYIGTYDYAIPLDTDDFFTPRSSTMKLKDYIKQYCYIEPAASCRFDWVHYFPECGMKGKVGLDGNVTAHLKNTEKMMISNFKSIHRTKAILDASFHDASCKECLLSGYQMVHIPRSVAFMAHVRFGVVDKDHKKMCN